MNRGERGRGGWVLCAAIGAGVLGAGAAGPCAEAGPAEPIGKEATLGQDHEPQQEGRPGDESKGPRPANRLAKETSPYLQQHAHNPVDWYPWGEEAFAKAREEDKPVFLSIGYSACHWCHVMAHESFEDEAVAAVMNELFVCVKVDREERPDVDELYMKAVQALTGGGGWPMSVWLTPDGQPFYGGTYFPPDDRFGRPGFVRVCRRMAELYRDEPDRVREAGEGLTEEIRRRVAPPPPSTEPLDAAVLQFATDQITESFDAVYGGFGGAPKFPHPMDLAYLIRRFVATGDERCREVVRLSLDRMAAGGIYDQLAGGFHRYSVDERWAVPHFEKMLYDNAQLARLYLEAWQVWGLPRDREVAREVLDYVLREMTSPEGGFYSAQDADSEGEEGKFFAWDAEEIGAVLGPEKGARMCAFLGVSEAGNFEHGKTVLSRPRSPEDFAREQGLEPEDWQREWTQGRAALLEARSRRIAPHRDEKVLVDWNGLMISAMARAGFVLEDERYLDAARRAADFLRRTMFPEGRMVRAYKDGKAHLMGNLGDHAMLIEGLLDLYEADFDPGHLAFAVKLAEQSLEHFLDEEAGGFFFTADDAEQLIARSKEAYDGATPSAASVHVSNLLRLSGFLGEPRWRETAEATLAVYGTLIRRQPRAVSRMMQAVHHLMEKPRELVLVAASRSEAEPLLDVLRSSFAPPLVVLLKLPEFAEELESISPEVRGKESEVGQPAAYVCRDFVCEAPVHAPQELRDALERR